jgi:hypothetical protein
MLNYLKKFVVDIFPSVAATVIGAYIVNHYIVSRPGADTPAAAVSTSTADSKARTATDANAAEGAPIASNLPAAGVKARGISEKAIMEKNAAERPAVAEKAQEKTDAKAEAKIDTAKVDTAKVESAKEAAKADTKADTKADARHDAKSAETPAEAAGTAGEPRRQQATPRDQAKEKIRVVLPSPIQPAASASAPVAAAPGPVAPVETAVVPAQEERRDANDLARAAIERLRLNGEGSARAPEVARIPDAHKESPKAEAPKVETPKADAPRVAAAPALRPLPPPLMVSAPPTAGEPYGQAAPQRPPYAANAEDPRRPTPPAEIPLSRPLDLRAEAAEPSVRDRTTAAAEEVLSTAKSLFHAVLPK